MWLNRWYATLLTASALFYLCPACSVTSSSEQGNNAQADRLIGAWRLVSIETIRPNGDVIYPFYGKHPEGLLIYDPSGWMSMQIVSDPKPTTPSTDTREKFLAAPSAEKVSAIDGYYAYFGTWTIDANGNSVTHHIRQSLYPGERGEDGTRTFSLEGDRLILTARAHEMSEDHQRKLIWERVPPGRR
jgi:Lipocalin-like domain